MSNQIIIQHKFAVIILFTFLISITSVFSTFEFPHINKMGWDYPTLITNNDPNVKSDVDPDIVMDNQQNSHIVWVAYKNDGKNLLMYEKRKPSGEIVLGPIILDTQVDHLSSPKITVDSNNDPHIIAMIGPVTARGYMWLIYYKVTYDYEYVFTEEKFEWLPDIIADPLEQTMSPSSYKRWNGNYHVTKEMTRLPADENDRFKAELWDPSITMFKFKEGWFDPDYVEKPVIAVTARITKYYNILGVSEWTDVFFIPVFNWILFSYMLYAELDNGHEEYKSALYIGVKNDNGVNVAERWIWQNMGETDYENTMDIFNKYSYPTIYTNKRIPPYDESFSYSISQIMQGDIPHPKLYLAWNERNDEGTYDIKLRANKDDVTYYKSEINFENAIDVNDDSHKSIDANPIKISGGKNTTHILWQYTSSYNNEKFLYYSNRSSRDIDIEYSKSVKLVNTVMPLRYDLHVDIDEFPTIYFTYQIVSWHPRKIIRWVPGSSDEVIIDSLQSDIVSFAATDGFKKTHLVWHETRGDGSVYFSRRVLPNTVIVDIDSLKDAYLNDGTILDTYPNIESIIDTKHIQPKGTVTQFPSITFAGHPTIFTGTFPGEHGHMGNCWFNRETLDYNFYSGIKIQTDKEGVYPPESLRKSSQNENGLYDGLANRYLDSQTIYSRASYYDINSMVSFNMIFKGVTLNLPPTLPPPKMPAMPWGAMAKQIGKFPTVLLAGAYMITKLAEYLNAEVIWAIAYPQLYDTMGAFKFFQYIKYLPEPPILMTSYYAGHDAAVHSGDLIPLRQSSWNKWKPAKIPTSILSPAYMASTVDPLVGKIKRSLITRGIYEDTLFIFTSDHGGTDSNPGELLSGSGIKKDVLQQGWVFPKRHVFADESYGTLEDNGEDYEIVACTDDRLYQIWVRSSEKNGQGKYDWSRPPLNADIDSVVEDILLDPELDKPPIANQDLLIKKYTGPNRGTYISYNNSGFRNDPDHNPIDEEYRTKSMFNWDRSADIIIMAPFQWNFFGDEVSKFGEQNGHGTIYDEDSYVPLIVAGEALKQFFPHMQASTIPRIAFNADVTRIIAEFYSIRNVGTLGSHLNEDNSFIKFFNDRLAIRMHSPAHIHLRDSNNKHVGYNNITKQWENEIPFSDYRIEEPESIIVYGINDSYTMNLEGYENGAFNLEVTYSKNNTDKMVEYVNVNITNLTKGNILLNDFSDLKLNIDYEGDGTFDDELKGNNSVIISKGVEAFENYSYISNISISLMENFSRFIDLSYPNFVSLNIISNKSINDGQINVNTTVEYDLDYPDLFGDGILIVLEGNQSIFDSVYHMDLIIYFDVDRLNELGILDKDLSIYHFGDDQWVKLNSTIDRKLNSMSANINSFGRFIVAATDKIPFARIYSLTPKVASDATSITIKVYAKDNNGISEVNVSINDSTYTLAFNETEDLYFINEIESPDDEGIYLIKLIAKDNNSNIFINPSSGYFNVDKTKPNITITYPSIDKLAAKKFSIFGYLNEYSRYINYSLDGGSSLSANISRDGLFGIDEFMIELEDLSLGDHSIVIYASDLAGLQNDYFDFNFTIFENDLILQSVDYLPASKVGKTLEFKASVYNKGLINETNSSIELYENDELINSYNFTILSNETIIIPLYYKVITAGEKNISVIAKSGFYEDINDDNQINFSLIATKNPLVLLVIDSQNSIRYEFAEDNVTWVKSIDYYGYLESLRDIGLTIAEWDIQSKGLPSNSTIQNFDAIVWFNGADKFSTISNEEKDLISFIRNQEIPLLISSPSLGFSKDFYEEDEFIEDVLDFSFIGVYKNDEIRIYPDNGIFSISDNFVVNSTNTFGNSYTNSIIEPINGAEPLFRYNDNSIVGILSDKDNSKLAFLSFAPESITDSDLRDVILEEIFNWFGIDSKSPIIIETIPTNNYTLPAFTTDVEVTFISNELSECRHSNSSGVFFGDMALFNITGSTLHKFNFTELKSIPNQNTNYIKCRDQKFNFNDTDFIFRINVQNPPPILDPIEDITINENETLDIIANASDMDNDTLNFTIEDVFYSYVVPPISYKFSQNQNVFTWNTSFNDSNAYKVLIKTFDPYGSFDSQEVQITVLNVNRVPVLDEVPDQFIDQGNFYYYDVNATDPDYEQLYYYDDNNLFDIDQVFGIISFNPKQVDIGIYDINISVKDKESVDYQIVRFEIGNVNDAPIINYIEPQNALNNTLYYYDANATDVDSENLTFSDNSTLFDIDPLSGVISFIPNVNENVRHTVNISVSDSEKTDFKLMDLLITIYNRPPILDLIENITVIETQKAVINATGYDPDK